MKWDLVCLAVAIFGVDAIKLHEGVSKVVSTKKHKEIAKDEEEDSADADESESADEGNSEQDKVAMTQSSPAMLNEPPAMPIAPGVGSVAPPVASVNPVPVAPPMAPLPPVAAAPPMPPPVMSAPPVASMPALPPPAAPMVPAAASLPPLPPMMGHAPMELAPLPPAPEEIIPAIHDVAVPVVPAAVPPPAVPVVAASPGTYMPPMVAPVALPIAPEVPPPMTPWQQYKHEIVEEINGIDVAMDDSDLTGPTFAAELQELVQETTPEMGKMMHHILEKEKVIKDVLVDPVLAEKKAKLLEEKAYAHDMIEMEMNGTEPPAPVHPPVVVPLLPVPQEPAIGMAEGKGPPATTGDSKPTMTTILIGAVIAIMVFAGAFYVLKK